MADSRLSLKRNHSIDAAFNGEAHKCVKRIHEYEQQGQSIGVKLDEVDELLATLKKRRESLLIDHEDIQKWIEEERTSHYTIQCRDIVNAVITKLPRELRDIIYGYVYETPTYEGDPPWPEPTHISFKTLDAGDSYHSLYLENTAFLHEWELPMYMWDTIVGSQFASEMAEIWYGKTEFVVEAGEVPYLVNDDLGVLGNAGEGAPARHIPREHIRSLTVNFRTDYETYSEVEDPLSWNLSRTMRKAADGLKSLLGPFGIKCKTGFVLHLQIICSHERDLERWLEAIGDVIYACKEEGFVIRVHHILGRIDATDNRPVPDRGSWKPLSGLRMARSWVTDVSRRFDRPYTEWQDRAKRSCYLAPPRGRDFSGKQGRLPVDSQYDQPVRDSPRMFNGCNCSRCTRRYYEEESD